MLANQLDRYVIGREQNVVRVNFARDPEPPTPPFPGAGALRLSTPPPDGFVSVADRRIVLAPHTVYVDRRLRGR